MKESSECREKFDHQAYLDQQMILPERIRFDKHLKECRPCREELAEYSRLFSDLEKSYSVEKSDLPTEDEVDRLMRRLGGGSASKGQQLAASLFGAIAELVRLQKFVVAGIGVFILAILFFATHPASPPPQGNGTVVSQPGVVPGTVPAVSHHVPEYSFALSAPPGRRLEILGDSTQKLSDSGSLEMGTIYHVPRVGKLFLFYKTPENKIELGSQSQFQVTASGTTLLTGELLCDFRAGAPGYRITTPAGSVTLNGTRFLVEVKPASTRVTLENGVVILRTGSTTVTMKRPGTNFMMADGTIKSEIGLKNISDAPISKGIPLFDVPQPQNEKPAWSLENSH